MKSGMIVVNKPAGISSAGVVARVKKKLGAAKVGHTGTLDPFATGVMLCAVNQATRISRYFLEGHKRYDARLHLGVETDTYDMTGHIAYEADPLLVNRLDTERITEVIQSFKGEQDQVPPSYSALKHKGTPLYKLARQGQNIKKPPRRIVIFEIQIQKIFLPYIDLSVHCSAGTYIRSLAFDIGRKLGCGAHLNQLCRIGSGRFELDRAADLGDLENMESQQVWEMLLPIADCLDFMPSRQADHRLIEKIRFGQKLGLDDIDPEGLLPEQPICILGPDKVAAAIVGLDQTGQAYKYSCVFAN